jgi:hypothetical protein
MVHERSRPSLYRAWPLWLWLWLSCNPSETQDPPSWGNPGTAMVVGRHPESGWLRFMGRTEPRSALPPRGESAPSRPGSVRLEKTMTHRRGRGTVECEGGAWSGRGEWLTGPQGRAGSGLR